MTRRGSATKEDPITHFVRSAENAALDDEKLRRNIEWLMRPERMRRQRGPHTDGDIDDVVNEMLKDLRRRRPVVAKDLDSTWEWRGLFAGVVSGMALGAWVGAQIGIATAGFGMAATVPGAILGGIIGGFTGREGGRHVGKRDEDATVLLLGPGGTSSKPLGPSQHLLNDVRSRVE